MKHFAENVSLFIIIYRYKRISNFRVAISKIKVIIWKMVVPLHQFFDSMINGAVRAVCPAQFCLAS